MGGGTMALTDEEKKLIEEQCKITLEQYKDALREVEVYKWIARVFFTLVLGGSIIGVFQLQGYLDDRIAKGTSSLEQLFYAKSLSDSGQYRDALPELLEYARSVSSTSIPDNIKATDSRSEYGDFNKAGPAIRTYFFLNLLDVLIGIPDNDPESASFGSFEWEHLQNNTRFQEDIIYNERFRDDGRVQNRLGLLKVKFAKTRDEVLHARYYFERELKYANNSNDRAAPAFIFAIYSLADNNIPDAKKHFLEANAASPNWVKPWDDYYASNDWVYWIKLFDSIDDFQGRYNAAYLSMNPPAKTGTQN
jgi:hypothetical protein